MSIDHASGWSEYFTIVSDPAHIGAEITWSIVFDLVLVWFFYGVVFKKLLLPKVRRDLHAEIDAEHGVPAHDMSTKRRLRLRLFSAPTWSRTTWSEPPPPECEVATTKHPISQGQESELTTCWREHNPGRICMLDEGHPPLESNDRPLVAADDFNW